jgi:hypothetical protein
MMFTIRPIDLADIAAFPVTLKEIFLEHVRSN